jgi:hypothetical protein
MRANVSRVIVAVLLVLAGCRQADGPLPAASGEQPNKIEDIGHDLRNLAGQQAGAEGDLLDDLQGLDREPPPEPIVRDLVTALQGALRGTELDDADAQQLARLLFVVTTGRRLSTRQIGNAGEDVSELLLKAGADAAAAQRAATAAMDVASAVTQNRKRWYHVGS